VTGGVTTNNDFLALFFPDVHHHVAVEKGARESVYCKARLKTSVVLGEKDCVLGPPLCCLQKAKRHP